MDRSTALPVAPQFPLPRISGVVYRNSGDGSARTRNPGHPPALLNRRGITRSEGPALRVGSERRRRRVRGMRKILWLVIPALLLLASSGALAQGTPEAEAQPTVFVRQDPALGSILTDPKGMTLYLFTKDTVEGESTCYDECAQNWPPFTANEPLAMPEFVDGELTSITRTDGT